jgi:hypothetical protein
MNGEIIEDRQIIVRSRYNEGYRDRLARKIAIQSYLTRNGASAEIKTKPLST